MRRHFVSFLRQADGSDQRTDLGRQWIFAVIQKDGGWHGFLTEDPGVRYQVFKRLQYIDEKKGKRMSGYTGAEQHVIDEIMKFDTDDIFTWGPNYFTCGWKKNVYYNFNYAAALALIGSLHGESKSRNSNYHRGVEYVANAAGVSKRQVKILRKKVKGEHGYWFKTPYTTAKIILKIIEELREHEDEKSVRLFLKESSSKVYREILISKQFEAIKAACKGNRKKVLDLTDELRSITVKVGDIT